MHQKSQCTLTVWSQIANLLTIAILLGATAWTARAQSIPAVEIYTMNSGTASSSSMISVSPTDNGEIYVSADGFNFINRENQLLVSKTGRFSSLIRLSTNNLPVWTREFDSTAITIWDTATMPDGGVVLIGNYTGSPGFPVDGSTMITNPSVGMKDIFICRYLPDGTMSWLRTGGGTNDETAAEVAVDNLGNIVVVGTVTTNATIGGTFIANQGQFLAKYDDTGSLLWIRSVIGDYSEGKTLGLDDVGNIYTGGRFRGDVNVGAFALKADGTVTSYKVNHDGFLAKYNSSGTPQWARRLGGDSNDQVSKIRAYLSTGVVCVGTYITNANFGATVLTSAGTTFRQDGFVSRLDSNGNWLWTRALSGASEEIPIGIGSDSNGEIFIGGYFSGTMTIGSTNLVSQGGYDSFITHLNSAGTLVWALTIGSTDRQNINDLLVTGPNEGYYWGDFATAIVDSVQTHTGSSINNGFYGRFEIPTPLQLTTTPVKTTGIVGDSITLSVEVTGTFPIFQWIKDGSPILGATSPSYNIPSLTLSDEGNYSVTIKNPLGTITTIPIFLGVYVRPQFTLLPVSVATPKGSNIVIQAQATGKPAPAIIWTKDDDTIDEQRGTTFRLNDIRFDHDGYYTVAIENAADTNYAHFRISVDMIPATSVGDFVHDPYRDVVYVSSGSEVTRFHLPTKTFLAPLTLGGSLQGLDVSPDGRYLVVADSSDQGVSNRVFVVNLDTTTQDEVFFKKQSGEGAFGSVAFGADGRAVLASVGQLRSFDPVSSSALLISQPGTSLLRPSADQQTIALLELNNTSGTLHRYTVASTNITTSASAGTGVVGTDAAIDQTGQRFARLNNGLAVFFDSALQLAGTLGNGAGDGPGGIAYHPQQDIVYVPWLGSTDVRAYNADTLTELARYKVDNLNLTANGRVRLSRSGEVLLTELPDGIRYTQLSAQPPAIISQPKSSAVAGGSSAVLSVTAYSPSSEITYQWQKDGVDIPEATGQSLGLQALDTSIAAAYKVKVSNDTGYVFSSEVLITVLPGNAVLAWSNPADIAYGTLLSGIQLNASTVAPGTLTYQPAIGTKLAAGNNQPLQVIFEPEDPALFSNVTNIVYINVQKKPLTITTPNVSRQYGIANPSLNLNIFGIVSGDSLSDLDVQPTVSTTATISSATGTYPITISGGSDDNYSFIYGPATLTVTKRIVSFTLADLDQAYNGSPRPVTVTANPVTAPYTVTYNGSTTVPTARGTYPVAVTLTDTNYQGSASGTLTIFKGYVPITWSSPTPFMAGTTLSANELNAVAAVPGIYAYTPDSGVILPSGTHTLTLVFTPFDTSNYLRTTNSVSFQVLPLTLANPAVSGSDPDKFQFEFTGINGVEYNVEVSNDLINWTVLSSFTATAGSVPIIDPAISANSRRFYRITPKP